MSRFSQYFKDLKIRSKLLGGYALVVFAALLAGGTIIVCQVEATIESHMESELSNTTAAILNMVKTAAATAIKNHLRAVAEKNRDIVQAMYDDYRSGVLTQDQAKALSRKILFSQTIGKTGYIFCANSKGIAIEHPNAGVTGKTFTDHAFVREMMAKKTGYLEYDWKNPEDSTLRPKAMYMVYFEPWDWIIAVSSYREEFRELINIDDFKDSILSLKFGKSGYAYINDSQGNLIVHPFMSGNYYNARDRDGHFFVQTMCRLKTGKAVYSWKNPGEAVAREKLVIFKYIPEYDWIVSSATYLDELYAPLDTVKSIIIVTVIVIALMVFACSLWINASVVAPLRALMIRFNQGASGNFGVRMPVRSKDEIGQLAGYFNRFMDRLQINSGKLKREIASRKQNENALRLLEEMFSKAFRSSPAGMFILSLESGRLINVNDSFLDITGHDLMDIIGKEMLSLTFFENRSDARALFEDIRHRRPVANREISFLTAKKQRRQGLLSGEKVELWGKDCMLGAMADITESRRLEREILDISQKEKQQFAMALHDDLCPQLIGIEVMIKMLGQRLNQPGSRGAGEADRVETIRQLVRQTIEKTRTLSQGLSPVNLQDRGFDQSLETLAAYVQNLFSITCTLEIKGGCPALLFDDNDIATHAYYIVHEAVHNAVKHAGCTRIHITLSCPDYSREDHSAHRPKHRPEPNGRTWVKLVVTDNGKGYDAAAVHTGLGVRIMSYRAGRISAALDISASPGTGTRVTLALPDTTEAT